MKIQMMPMLGNGKNEKVGHKNSNASRNDLGSRFSDGWGRYI